MYTAQTDSCNAKAAITDSRNYAMHLLHLKFETREHWIRRITFAAETNAADTHTHTQHDSVTPSVTPSVTIPEAQDATVRLSIAAQEIVWRVVKSTRIILKLWKF